MFPDHRTDISGDVEDKIIGPRRWGRCDLAKDPILLQRCNCQTVNESALSFWLSGRDPKALDQGKSMR
jgi:hypothetical protein